MTKSIWRGLICFALALGVAATHVSALSYNDSIQGFSGNRSLEDNFPLGQSGHYQDVVAGPDDEIRIPITADMFDWGDGRVTKELDSVNLHQLRGSRIRLGTTVRSGSSVLEYIQISIDDFDGKPFYNQGTLDKTARTAYISVKFSDKITAVDPVAFEYDIRVSLNGRSSEEMSLKLMGECGNETYIAGGELQNFNMSDGTVLQTTYPLNNVSLTLGSGVTAHASLLSSNTKFYGLAYFTDSVQAIREEWPDVYPDIKMVYYIHTINIQNKAHCKVTLTPPDIIEAKNTYTVFYVYDKDMKYLGRSDEPLAFSEYYFLSTREIETMEQGSYEQSLVDAPVSIKS